MDFVKIAEVMVQLTESVASGRLCIVHRENRGLSKDSGLQEVKGFLAVPY